MAGIAWVNDLVRDLPGVIVRGYARVAIPARVDRPLEDLDALAEAGVLVVAVRLYGDLTLADVRARREEFRRLQRQISDGARLGATLAWLPPPLFETEQARTCFEEGITLLADYARGMQIAVQTESLKIDLME